MSPARVPRGIIGKIGRQQEWPGPLELVLHDHFAGRALAAPWTTSLVGGAGQASVTLKNAPTAVYVTSGDAANTSASLFWGTPGVDVFAMLLGLQRSISLSAKVKFSAVTADSQLYIGLTTAVGITSDGLFFGIDGPRDSAKFFCLSRNASVATWVSTAIAVDTAWHKIEIKSNESGPSVDFSLDGQLLTSITTNLPSDSNDWMQPLLYATNGATVGGVEIVCDALVIQEGGA